MGMEGSRVTDTHLVEIQSRFVSTEGVMLGIGGGSGSGVE